MRILAGDIGGTKTELALLERSDAGAFAIRHSERFPSREHPGLESVIDAFFASPFFASHGQNSKPSIAGAAFGVAGPVRGRTSQITNLPWQLDADSLARQLGSPTELLNDFQAVALGVGVLSADELHPLQERARDATGPMCVLGAGTGLGEAVLVPTDKGPRVLASEGGHVDFAPRNPVELRLLEFLWRKHSRVSVERVVSGLALPELFAFVVDAGLATPAPTTLEELQRGDAAAVIGERGQDDQDPACRVALDLFVNLYGAEAGNLALKVLPTGGLFVAGGIAPRLLTSLTDGRFVAAMLDKGRMRPLLEAIPVHIVLSPQVGLWGAARFAAQGAGVIDFRR